MQTDIDMETNVDMDMGVNSIPYTGLSRRRRCLVQPEAEMSRMAADRVVSYGQSRRCLGWAETEMSCMPGDDCRLWYDLMAFCRTGTFIYILALWPSWLEYH